MNIFGKRDNSLLLGINFRWRKLIQSRVSSNKSFKFWLEKIKCIFPCDMVRITVLTIILSFKWFYVFFNSFYWKINTSFYPKIKGIFLQKETALSVHGMKSYEKLVFSLHYGIFWKTWYMLWFKGIFVYF